MARRHHLVEPYDLLGRARLDSIDGLPTFMDVARGAGSWSRQTAPAVDGTTFIETGTDENTPRWDYDEASVREMLLVEPARTNIVPNSNFVDTTPNNGTPDGWTKGAGADGVDFQCLAGGPHGGTVYRAMTASSTHYQLVVVPGATLYQTSLWVRRVTAAGAYTINTIDTPPGTGSLALGAATHDWQRYLGASTTVGAGAAVYFLYRAAGSDDVRMVLPMAEAGDCATSYADGARAAELCTIDPAVVGRTSGYVSMKWRPDFASTAALTESPVLFAWAPNWELYYDPADDKLKLTVDGAAGAVSAAMAFTARASVNRIQVRYGSWGTALTVNGVTTTDPSAWGTPVLACYLGSRAASANCRPAGYADLVFGNG